MSMLRRLRHLFAIPLIATMVIISMPLGVAQAGLVGSDAIVASEVSKADRQAVEAFLQRQDVRDQLEGWGIAAAEAEQRVAALSDAEIAQIAGSLPDDPAGQGIEWVIGVAVFVFLVLLVTDILGFTSVYPFTRSAR